MELIRLNRENVAQYVGKDVLFKTRGVNTVKTILGYTDNGIKVDHPDLGNNLVFSRNLRVIIN